MISLKKRLTELLIKNELISQEDLNKALSIQKEKGGRLSEILVELGFVNEDDLAIILSQSLGLPPLDLSRVKVDPEVIKIIPEEVARYYQIIPVSKIGKALTLAMADPLNVFAIDDVKALTGFDINPIVGRPKEVMQAIDTYYSKDSHEVIESIMQEISDAEKLEVIRDSTEVSDVEELARLTQEAPVIKLTETIVRQAIAAKASDILIEPLESKMRLRYRIDGLLREVESAPKNFLAPIISRIKVISGLDIAEHRLPQDGRFKIKFEKREVDFRVSVLPSSFGEKIALRILDKSAAMLDIEKLGFNPQALKVLKNAASRPYGMILSCGPTGCGKTTTLYSILKHVDSPDKNIITVEDPVEYQLGGINQVNANSEIGLTFVTALRSILRQDPDIIMIGEIRDFETVDIAIKSALTGHLVLSTLHTTTASGSIVRLINMGVEPFLITSSVICIIAQRLVRKICERCKEPIKLNETILKKIGVETLSSKKMNFFKGQGCKYCFNTGYSGRTGIVEILVLAPEIKELILAQAEEHKIKKVARLSGGMITLREDGLNKAREGLTSLEEVLRITAPDEKI
ncbi:MAG: Flp pilus assembly complex ATPase component TadA [Candidatus Atribacteria bacterium]|nr:Flp pilus assembly complex ATPase component TadA [Candidatus Atribacteria bacterium]